MWKERRDALKGVLAGEKPDEALAEWLWSQQCLDLLGEMAGPYGEQAQMAMTANSLAIQARYAACREVFQKLEAAAVPYAVVKGAVLSEAAYGSPAVRRSADIDLLIDRRDCETVRAVLVDAGFTQGYVEDGVLHPYSRESKLYYGALSHQMAPFIQPLKSPFCPFLNVDVNTDIFWGESGWHTDIHAFLSETEETSVAGITVRKLPRERELIALCLHHYKDMHSAFLLSQDSLRLSLFRDIAGYVSRQRPDAGKLAEEAARWTAAPVVYVCLYHTNQLFPDDALAALLTPLWSAEGERLLGVYGLNAAEERPWPVPFPFCVFDPTFSKQFYNTLDEAEKQKVAVNRRVL